MNKQKIAILIQEREEYFLNHAKELGFFICNLYLYCHKDEESIWDFLSIENAQLKEMILDLELYATKRLGEDRGLRNGFEGSHKKTLQDWIMILKSTYPLVYKTDMDCLKKIFLSVSFINPWLNGFLLSPLHKKSNFFYEDVIDCENQNIFEDQSLLDISKEISKDQIINDYKKDLYEQFSKFMTKELKEEQMTDQAMLFLGEKERYKVIDFSHIKYMNFRSMPINVDQSYISGAINCLQGILFNVLESNENRKIAQKELTKMKEKFKNEKK